MLKRCIISHRLVYKVSRRLYMSASEKNRPYRIAIIGAGAAGIGAARWLLDNVLDSNVDHSESSFEVTVFEAKNRTGGRVYTYASEGTAKGLYDVGASWIHDPSSNPLAIMAKSMKLTTKETDFDEDVLTDLTGKRWDERSSEKAFSRFEKVLFATASAARKKSLQDVSFDEVIARKLDMTSPLHHLHLSGLEFELGAPLRNCSATECIDDDWFESVNGVGDSNSAHLPSYDEPCDLVLPEGGFSELFVGIASGAAFEGTTMQPWLRQPEHAKDRMPLNVRLNQKVISISQREVVEGDTSAPGGGVVVVTAKCLDPSTAPSEVLDTASPATPLAASCDNSATYGDSAPAGVDTISAQYTADAVIVTVPLGVLKAGSITFTPPLSTAKQQAIAEVGFGNVVKVIIEFPQVFWPTHTPFLSLADAALANPLERGLLTYFLNGHFIAGKKVLVGYGLGEAAATVDEMSDEELTRLIMSRMRSISLPGRKLPAAPLRIIRTRWAADPHTRGVYSHWAPGNRPGIRAELGRREGNVWFAGEAVQESSMLSSSVHGAWLSGVAAAAEVCEHLGLPVTLPTTLAPMG